MIHKNVKAVILLVSHGCATLQVEVLLQLKVLASFFVVNDNYKGKINITFNFKRSNINALRPLQKTEL